MDITSIATLIANSGITALTIACLIAGLIWHRTGSSHTLMNRLWASFNGKKSCTVPAIQNTLDEQAALMQFRFTTGLKARTVAHAETLIQWAQAHDENVTDIAACGPYFSLEDLAIKNRDAFPRPWKVILTGLIILVLTAASALAIVAMGKNKALLQFTESNTLFWLDTRSADTLWHSHSLPLGECNVPIIELAKHDTGFTAEEINIICKQAASLTKEAIQKSVSEMRWTLLALLIGFVAGLHFSFRFLQQVINARDMEKRLAKRNPVAQTVDSGVLSQTIP